jgi:hypothetical protein
MPAAVEAASPETAEKGKTRAAKPRAKAPARPRRKKAEAGDAG